MSCTECKSPTPPLWTRCYDCAFAVLRRLMSPFPIAVGKTVRKFGKGSRVIVMLKSSDPAPPGSMRGVVVRRQGTTYVVQLDDGSRYYAESSELQPAEAPS